MSYTSFLYLIFIISVFCIYYLVRPRLRWMVLLAANFIFYVYSGWDNLLVILISISVSWLVSVRMGNLHARFREMKAAESDKARIRELKEKNRRQRQRWLLFGLFAVLLVLIAVKYTNFLLGSAYSVMGLLGLPHSDYFFRLVMPLGISFYTFQIISYLVDVYKGKIEPQRNFAKYAMYVSFFPSVVQGPIPRYSDLGEQLFAEHRFDFDNLRDGALLILWGFAKKLILAERLNLFVTDIYDNYTKNGSVLLMLATVAYSIQIYADFSSCMDIAGGTARLFGIRLAPNFLRPYFSKTMPEFWRRWHVTLGNWFRDYVFYPISISKFSLKLNKKTRKLFGGEIGRIVTSCIPVLAVWILTGIWHGPEWKFVIWGLFHGVLIMLSTIFAPHIEELMEKLHVRTDCFSFRLFQMCRTFFLCCVGRVFFRADSLGMSLGIFKRIFTTTGVYQLLGGRLYRHGLNSANMKVVICAVIVLFVVSFLQEREDVLETFKKQNLVFRWALVYALFFAVLIFGCYGPGYDASAFIYENF